MSVGRTLIVSVIDGPVLTVDYQVGGNGQIAWWVVGDDPTPELTPRQIDQLEHQLARDLEIRRQRWRDRRECVA